MKRIPKRHTLAGLFISLSAAFLLLGYEFLRSTSNALYKAAYGADNLPIVMACMPIGVIGSLYIYGKLLTKFGARRTLLITALGSACLILLCYFSILQGFDLATAALYIVREVYVILLIEQYWSFINSSLSESSSRILNGPITGIASLGAICGGWLLGEIAIPYGAVNTLVFAALVLIPSAWLSNKAYLICGEPQSHKAAPLDLKGNFGLRQFNEPKLRALFLVIVVTQIISTVLSLRFQGLLQIAIPDIDAQSAYSGRFYALLNLIALILQFGITPLLLRLISLRAIHIMIPCIHLISCAVLTGSPTLGAAGGAYLLFKAFDYSLFRAAKELLYIPLSFAARYRTKEVIDLFGYRVSKGATSLVLVAFQSLGAVLTPLYSVIAMIASAGWIGLTFPLTRKNGVSTNDLSLPITESKKES